ncbi:MAG: prepilin-type N-terminal cleavage/methylation domain-containing protein [Verrucomicrobia bacterium]|nr:prepilin-type N-terminal cleavage/methylation domain-containing protein [Verrucomicrobiota bacterium]
MNLETPIPAPVDQARHRARRAFSITELMITTAILSLVILGVLASNLFGARLHQITKVKLGASDEARGAISLLISEIRSAKILKIGGGTMSSFTQAADGTPQRGDAIQIYASTNTNAFVRYFRDGSDSTLKRITNSATDFDIIANYISNSVVFTAEDHRGTVLTNQQNNRVIGLTLQFYQVEYPVVSIGPGNYYDFYQLRTRVTRRMLE